MFQILLGRSSQQAGALRHKLRSVRLHSSQPTTPRCIHVHANGKQKPSADGHIPLNSLRRQGAAWAAGGVGVGSTLFGVYKLFNSFRSLKYIK
ncbi:hypothetical protein P175DRAFT_0342054 [Aspergillus ochraceoroseus IBT 24754]|uniref:Uncharacterized protein n=1 Tax=Aspergillus ochraceoroseus IBT 24754 TaxID=1392256 RepID=A0A2T5LRV3_9EURO|nr:uncharacterized protein P175DRAFT_0342054 [Aspergillus ochraceoroseus IBT 24754]PTU19005.1 hypothetical protein P175DRAFT_0342054 [Aspergillus ochraceoroseus IBT 24754]